MSDPTPTPTYERVAATIGSLWWLPLLRGVLLIILGAYALFRPGMTAIMLAQVIGIYIVLDGILAIIAGVLGDVPSRGWIIVRGVLEILLGIFVFAYPVFAAGLTAKIVLTVIGIGAIVSGLLEIIAAIRDRRAIEGEGWLILGGLLAIVFGVLVLMAPFAFGQLLIRILGAYAILFGIALISLAFRVRKVGKLVS